jgi:putative membrane protein
MTQLPRYKVHTSFIWLGGIQVSLSILLVFAITVFSFGIGRMDSPLLRDNSTVLALIIGVALVGFILIAGLIFLQQYFKNPLVKCDIM